MVNSTDRRWPIGIVIGFLFVALINAGFVYLAVTGADPVVSSYNTPDR